MSKSRAYKVSCSDLTNKEMGPVVYALRRKVIDLIYQAGELVDLPRITVRVTENHKSILGVGGMGRNIVWITADMVASRAVVFHEILHAVYAQGHVEGCPLMAPAIDHNLDDATCNRLFVEYATGKGLSRE